jgi:hypothetical protein
VPPIREINPVGLLTVTVQSGPEPLVSVPPGQE